MFYTRYRQDLEAAWNRVGNCGSRVAQTSHGPIEYVEFGEGPPVLWIHGVVGGCDQGHQAAETFVGAGFRFIAVSRFGYLGSPLPDNSSPAAQADLYAALLDTLGIRQAALVGTSAGGPSSLQFGLRHPDRCSALILWSMAVPPYPVPSRHAGKVMTGFFGSDFAFWLVITYLPSLMLDKMALSRAAQARLAPADRIWLAALLQSLLPVSLRVKGIMNDIRVSNPNLNQGYPLTRLSVPTLVIHAADDPMPPFAGARRMAERISGARFIAVDWGGHLLLAHHQKVRREIAGFIREHLRAMATEPENQTAGR